jgi:hypothetical protein
MNETEIEIHGVQCYIETIEDGSYKGYIDTNKFNGDEPLDDPAFYCEAGLWEFDTTLDQSRVWRLSDVIKSLEDNIQFLLDEDG